MSRKLLKQAMDDAYAIRLAKTELRDAYNRGDVNGVLAAFADSYSDMSAGLASFYGTEAQAVLQYRMKQLFARYRAQLAVTIISIRVQGPLAFDWGWHKLTLTPKKGGRSMTTRTRYLEIWQKAQTEDGRSRFFSITPTFHLRCHPKEVLREMGNGHLGTTKSKVIAIA